MQADLNLYILCMFEGTISLDVALLGLQHLPYIQQKLFITLLQPASEAQWDIHPTGDQEVVGSIPAGSGNILS